MPLSLLSAIAKPPFTTQLTEPLSQSSVLVGSTMFVIMSVLGLIMLGLPILRALGMMVSSARWLSDAVPKLWTRRATLVDPERPLDLSGLSPDLARLARQTRTLSLELRRRSEEARHWPEDAGELEPVRVPWWNSFARDLVDFTPLMDTRREVYDWLHLAESLGAEDREALARLGVDIEAVRAALTHVGRVAVHVRVLAGLMWSIDERLADGTCSGYRSTGARVSTRGGALVQFPRSDGTRDGEPETGPEPDERARQRRFARLLGRHGRGLSNMANSYARSPAEREDLEQDIALALWQSLPKFRGESKLETFAYRVARYCCYRYVRRRGRMPTEDDALARLGDPVDLEQELLAADVRAQVERALAQLPDTLESTLSLHLSGLSYAEIAERLGISERNVSVRLTRARHRLREQLAA